MSVALTFQAEDEEESLLGFHHHLVFQAPRKSNSRSMLAFHFAVAKHLSSLNLCWCVRTWSADKRLFLEALWQEAEQGLPEGEDLPAFQQILEAVDVSSSTMQGHAMAAKGNDRAMRQAALASEHGNKNGKHVRRAEVGHDLHLRTVFSLIHGTGQRFECLWPYMRPAP